MRFLQLAFIGTLLSLPLRAATDVQLQTRTNYTFAGDGVTIDNKFPGARLNFCERIGKHHYRIHIKPENTPINRSPWYAFRVRSTATNSLSFALRYQHAVHRYHPLTSHDGITWTSLPKSQFTVSPRKTEATITLTTSNSPIWICARELLDQRRVDNWINTLVQMPNVTRSVIGKSVKKRTINALSFGSNSSTNFLLIVGRQHPPEVSGALGLMAFVEELLNDSGLSRRFRDQLAVRIVPMMNPDGVAEGHSRHNLGGVDLNRDWKDFRQPETRTVRDWLVGRLKKRKARPLLFLDFHSTYHDVFYTQADEHPTIPPGFTKAWLEAIGRRLPDYRVTRSASHNMDKPTSKAWTYDRFGCPAITYEFGDHTDRKLVRKQAQVAAQEMMKLLLKFIED